MGNFQLYLWTKIFQQQKIKISQNITSNLSKAHVTRDSSGPATSAISV